MTESEAIKVLEKPSKHIRMVHKTKNEMEFYTYSADLVEAFEKAISALEEVQQLHAIGTVSEFRELKEKEERFDKNIKMFNDIGCDIAKKARAKVIEEFAERLKKHKFHSKERFENCVPVCQIDWIAKEMKGE